MNVVTKFILIVAGIALASGFGYLARKKNWLDEAYAGPLMFYTVIFGWTPASAAVLWPLPLQWSLVALLVFGILMPVILVPFGYFFSRLHKLDPKSAGTFIVGAGIANTGFTMGGFICYCLFGTLGLGYANLYCSIWALPYVLVYYPLARRFVDPNANLSAGFLLRSFFDARSLPILGSIVGLLLNLLKVPMPPFISDFHLVDLFIIGSILVSFATIGLQIHFSHLAQKKILHLSLAVVKFIITPALMVLILYLSQFVFGTLPPLARKVVYIQTFMPTAIFTVVISNLFDLNPRLASMLFLVNTVIFLILVLPALACFLS
jgi:predicted permease